MRHPQAVGAVGNVYAVGNFRLTLSVSNVVPVHCTHALPQSLSPLADSRVNDSLLQIIPHINEALLQLVDFTTYMTFIYLLLHDSQWQIL